MIINYRGVSTRTYLLCDREGSVLEEFGEAGLKAGGFVAMNNVSFSSFVQGGSKFGKDFNTGFGAEFRNKVAEVISDATVSRRAGFSLTKFFNCRFYHWH